MALNNPDKARVLFRRAIRADSKDPQTMLKYGLFLEKTEKLREAEEHYLQTLEIDPTHINCNLCYAGE